MLNQEAQPLESFDPGLLNKLVDATRELGVEVLVNTAEETVARVGDHFIVKASTKEGERILETDLVVHGAGRVPDIDDLDLEQAGVKRESKGVSVNAYLQSVSNPPVYAAGDAAASSGLPLTPVASMEGYVVASNMLNGIIASRTTPECQPWSSLRRLLLQWDCGKTQRENRA